MTSCLNVIDVDVANQQQVNLSALLCDFDFVLLITGDYVFVIHWLWRIIDYFDIKLYWTENSPF